jgi:2-polyprenyl-6-methoxyphenol hydroxylase-like FAD-dependent oxidoreductase
LDTLLVDRASVLGVIVLQPARVSSVRGDAGNFSCEIQSTARPRAARVGHSDMHRAAVVVDAHGSWDAEPSGEMRVPPARRRPSDLFGFKASFADAALPTGVLPVIAFPGGYGGMVLAEDGRATVAGCIRRDFLHGLRGRLRHASAGEAFERHLRDSCPGMQAALTGARRMGNWLSVGPLRLGSRVRGPSGLFRVGNAAGETHPLIGEGMSMALESAFLLASHLTRFAVDGDSVPWIDLHRTYETAWRAAFAPRMRVASAYAHLAMQPVLNAPTQAVLRRWPSLLTKAARLAGKARPHHLGITPEGTS